MSVDAKTRYVVLEPPRDAVAAALDQAEQYGLATSRPPSAAEGALQHSLNDHISNLAQNLPDTGADIESTRRWLNAALDFRQTALKHPVAWTGAELHSLSGLELCEYLVECGLGKCQAREVARDIVSARETRATWITKITEMKQTMIEQAQDTCTEDFKVCDTIRMSSILACLFMIVVATSVGLIH
ncbi:hypothetical protein CGCSCA5_v012738 [Colletotrichum siamense]|nr:hypothetical protein CGCSCA5_v012738 [Colletotrichum siamense]